MSFPAVCFGPVYNSWHLGLLPPSLYLQCLCQHNSREQHQCAHISSCIYLNDQGCLCQHNREQHQCAHISSCIYLNDQGCLCQLSTEHCVCTLSCISVSDQACFAAVMGSWHGGDGQVVWQNVEECQSVRLSCCVDCLGAFRVWVVCLVLEHAVWTNYSHDGGYLMLIHLKL